LNSGVPIEKTSMADILSSVETGTFSALQKEGWWSELQEAATAASGWFAQQGIEAENTANKEARDAALAEAERLLLAGIPDGSSGGVNKTNGGINYLSKHDPLPSV
jgi:hypothetical protein